jgi:hypothetical protein
MNLELPCLERLTVELGDQYKWNPIAKAAESWTMPKLRHLTRSAFTCETRLSAPLTSLRVYLQMFNRTSPFMSFLSSPVCKTLRNLEVEFFRIANDDDFMMGLQEECSSFELEELRYLRIETCSLAYEVHEHMYAFARNGYFPKLEKLELKIDISEERETYNRWKDWLVNTEQDWEDSLATIDIFVCSDSRRYFNQSEFNSLRNTSDVMKKMVPKLEKFRLTYLDEDENQVGNVFEL